VEGVFRRAARLHRATAIVMVGVAMAGCTALAPLLGSNGLPGAVVPCSWPLRVAGHATAAQAGLVRCYLRAVAEHDLAALQGLVNPTYRVTKAQLTQTADARAGRASATITPNSDNTGIATVRIDYADGAACQFGIEIVNPQSAGSWRIDIGPPVPGPQGPSPAKTPAG
jgi:hypothetical protein